MVIEPKYWAFSRFLIGTCPAPTLPPQAERRRATSPPRATHTQATSRTASPHITQPAARGERPPLPHRTLVLPGDGPRLTRGLRRAHTQPRKERPVEAIARARVRRRTVRRVQSLTSDIEAIESNVTPLGELRFLT